MIVSECSEHFMWFQHDLLPVGQCSIHIHVAQAMQKPQGLTYVIMLHRATVIIHVCSLGACL